MTLRDLELLFLDCQTTGIRPPNAHLLEIAWASARAGGEVTVHSHLVRLPDGVTVPRLVTEMTGIADEHLTEARARVEVADLLRAGIPGIAMIHYAQFEKPFLADLLGEVPFEIFCTHQLAKRLFPKLPSRNIRATAGFFGPPVLGHNRAATFVRATTQIWGGLVTELERKGVTDLETLRDFLTRPLEKAKRGKPATGYEYRLDKVKRLKLPDAPGVYRMLGASGEVLYVGKATSLRSRVNSYFRGKKGRDQRKLEMLAQVWDLDVTDCGSPLEAALLESDEIKRLNPPYNVMLRTGRRHLVFYNQEFSESSREQSATFSRGPFRNHNWIEHLRLLRRSLERDRFEQIFFDPIPAEDLEHGFDTFCARHGVTRAQLKTVRAQLALGLWLHRAHVEPEIEPTESDASEDDEESAAAREVADVVLSPDEIADKFDRLFRRAARELRRGRSLTGLLSAEVQIGGRTLRFTRGRLRRDADGPNTPEADEAPWRELGVDTFDRMSILLSELTKRSLGDV